MEFYDTHAHLTWPDFQSDLDGVIQRAHAAGISKIISIGTNFETSRAAIKIAETYPNIYAAVGFHPGDAMEAPPGFGSELRQLAQHPKVVAIGEIGLDYYRLPGKSGGSAEDDAAIKKRQREVFEEQLQIAEDLGLNCVIHTRESFTDTLAVMRERTRNSRGVFHCFVDDPASMQAVLATGGLVSYTGICTFKNSQSVRDTITATPLDKFMLETDAPFLAPVPYRGKRCEPAYVKDTAEAIAALKKGALEELSHATCATARKFFPKMVT